MFGQPVHFAIMGPSGAGKTTVVEAVKDNFPGLGLQKQHNYATRKMRKKEIAQGGSDYIHISEEEYKEAFDRGDYIGYRLDNGKDEDGNLEVQNYGGVAPHINKVVFITDEGGYDKLSERSKKTGERIVSIFIEADKEVCHQRMAQERGEEAAQSRTDQYETFLGAKEKCECVINTNHSVLDQSVKELYEILLSESLRHIPYY